MIFDMDGVLTNSKLPIGEEAARAVNGISVDFEVAIISGSKIEQMKAQLVPYIDKRILLLPNSGTKMFQFFGGDYNLMYGTAHFTKRLKKEIIEGFKLTRHELKIFENTEIYGEQIEDRGSQITFSALGQDAPYIRKIAFDPTNERRTRMLQELRKLPVAREVEFNLGGTTSIDATPLGLNKGKGVERLLDEYKFKPYEAFFIGDQLDKGGNDYPVAETGVPCFRVFGVPDTTYLCKYLGRTLSAFDYPEVR